MIYAISVVAERLRPDGGAEINHSAFAVEAANADEALGKGLRVGIRIYRAAFGWKNHHVSYCPALPAVTDPETVTVNWVP